MGVLLFAAGSSRCVVVVVDRDERMREKQWRRKDFGSCFCPYKIGEDGEEGGGSRNRSRSCSYGKSEK